MSTLRPPTPKLSYANKGMTPQARPAHGNSSPYLYPAAQSVNAKPGDNFLSVAMRASSQETPPLYHRK